MLSLERRLGWQRSRQDGAAAVEFALILPILMALVMGIIQFGWYFFAANAASSASREAARQVAVGECWDPTEFEDFVKAQVSPSLNVTSATVSPPPTQVGDVVKVLVKVDTDIVNYIPGVPDEVAREFNARIEDDKEESGCP